MKYDQSSNTDARSWRAELGGDWRWSYSGAVEAGIIPKDLSKTKELAKC